MFYKLLKRKEVVNGEYNRVNIKHYGRTVDDMPTWKYLYTCSKTGAKIYKMGRFTKKVYPDGKVSFSMDVL